MVVPGVAAAAVIGVLLNTGEEKDGMESVAADC